MLETSQTNMGWAATKMARVQRHVKNHSIAAAAVPAVPAAAVAAAAIAACAVGTASASAAASAPASVASAHVARAATAFSENDRVCLLTSYCLKTFSKRLVSKEEILDVVLHRVTTWVKGSMVNCSYSPTYCGRRAPHRHYAQMLYHYSVHGNHSIESC